MNLKPAIIAAAAVLLFAIIPLLSFRLVVFNKSICSAELNKLGVGDVSAAYGVIDYLKGSTASVGGFEEREILHLADVRDVINSALITLYLLIALFALMLIILYMTDKNFLHDLKVVFLLSSAGIVFFSGALFLLSSQFDFLFVQFHEIFFEQGSWIFPPGSRLVTIFPQAFFQNIFYKIILNSALFSAIILIVLIFLRKKQKNFK